jgi:hypothetical protein
MAQFVGRHSGSKISTGKAFISVERKSFSRGSGEWLKSPLRPGPFPADDAVGTENPPDERVVFAPEY